MSFEIDPGLLERFWPRVIKTDECWLWTGGKTTAGYGLLGRTKTSPAIYAHRLSYMIAKGPISDRAHLDHLCRVRHCVRPDHLEEVTQKENILRGSSPSAIAARTGICQRGHLFKENGVLRKSGRWMCRVCNNNQAKVRRARKREARDKSGV